MKGKRLFTIGIIYTLLIGCSSNLDSLYPTEADYLSTPSDGDELATITPTVTDIAPSATPMPTETVEPHIPIVSSSPIIQVAAGPRSLALRADGRVYGWSHAENLGIEGNEDGLIPAPVLLEGLEEIASIDNPFLFINTGGMIVYSFGGDVQVFGDLRNVVWVDMYAQNIIALLDDGTVWRGTGNIYHAINNRERLEDNTFVQLPIEDVMTIETIGSIAWAIKADGTLWQWGDAAQTASIIQTSSDYPQQIPLSKPAIDVDVSIIYTVLYNDGTMGYWDWYGIGPPVLKDLEGIVSGTRLDSGWNAITTQIISEDGTLLSVRTREGGEPPVVYGYGNTPDNVISTSSNGLVTIALDITGAVWTVGPFNDSGELGTGEENIGIGTWDFVPIIVSE